MKRMLFCFTVLFLSSYCYSNGMKVYYAGFAFIGDADKLELNYPASLKISKEKDEKGSFLLENELKKRIDKFKSNKLDLSLGLGDIKDASAISLAFAVDWENVAIEKVLNLYKFIVSINAQILVFDFKEKKIIASFPISVDLIDTKEASLFSQDKSKEVSVDDIKKSKLYSETIEQLVRQIYFNPDEKNNIFDIFIKKLASLDIKEKYGHRIKVNDIKFEEKALTTFKELNVDPVFAKNFIANNFIKYLSTNQNVSVLPFVTGSAIGKKMSARFMNGDVYNLEIPKSDYDVDITTRGFKTVEFDRTASVVGLVFGTYFSIKVFQPDLDKTYLEANFTGKGQKTISVFQEASDVDKWSTYQETMLNFFNNFTLQINKQQDKWLKESSDTPLKDLKPQLKLFDELLKKCR
jgi:hypothetical protein